MMGGGYSEEQRDCLQELCNVAMGQAGASLARLLDTFVVLSVPVIRIIETQQIPQVLAELAVSDRVSALRQGFRTMDGLLSGECLALYGSASCSAIAGLMGLECETQAQQDEVLLELGSVLAGVCLPALGEQLEESITLSPPQLIGHELAVSGIVDERMLNWTHALAVDIRYSLESQDFSCHLIFLMPDEAIKRLALRLDELLADD